MLCSSQAREDQETRMECGLLARGTYQRRRCLAVDEGRELGHEGVAKDLVDLGLCLLEEDTGRLIAGLTDMSTPELFHLEGIFGGNGTGLTCALDSQGFS